MTGLLQRCAHNGVAWLVHDDDAYIKIFHRVHNDRNNKFSSKFCFRTKRLMFLNIDYCHIRNDKHLLLLLIIMKQNIPGPMELST